MDKRVVGLLDELRDSASLDPLAARNQIVRLFGKVTAEQDRVALLLALQAVIVSAIRDQQAKDIDTRPLRNALLADKRSLANEEAMGPNGLLEPTELLRILEREIGAGRMEPDEFYDLAMAGAKDRQGRHL